MAALGRLSVSLRAGAAAPARLPFRGTAPAAANVLALRSTFVRQAPVTALGFRSALGSRVGLAVAPLRRLVGREVLIVENNNMKGKGCTLGGTRRARARVSGFRARIATAGGRKCLKRRRAKGRHNISPANRPAREK